jgi:hypothetical protein
MEYLCLFFALPLVIGVFGMLYHFSSRSAAKQAYVDSLERLKRDPQNPNLREQTLALGRAYARKGGCDEVALMNDINAACARAATHPAPAGTTGRATVEERLAKLDELRGKGLITDQEHQMRRKQILDEV